MSKTEQEVIEYGILEYERGRAEALEQVRKELPNEIPPETRGDRMRQRWNNGFNRCVQIVNSVFDRHQV